MIKTNIIIFIVLTVIVSIGVVAFFILNRKYKPIQTVTAPQTSANLSNTGYEILDKPVVAPIYTPS
jgi:hypothetical protein